MSDPRLRGAARVVVAVGLTFVLTATLFELLGAAPYPAFRSIVSSALGTRFNLGQTVMIATLLALTGLSAAIPFRAGLWNIGGEGQLYAGAFAAAAVGLTLPSGLPAWIFPVLVLAGSAVGGAAWAFVPAILRVAAGANEVITSLMMNSIALLLADYAITSIWPQGVAPQTADMPGNSLLPVIWGGSLITVGAPIALVVVLAAAIVMSRTTLGFEIRAVGANAGTSRLAGIAVERTQVVAFVLGGSSAGLAGGIAVIGLNGALVSNFSANFGYIGIAVALVARLRPAWIIPSALFFAILRVGSNGLQVQTGLSTSMGEVLVAGFILVLLAFGVVRFSYGSSAESG